MCEPNPPRVLLVYPPSRTQSHRSCPAGILMLAAVLEQAGHQVRLLDANSPTRRSAVSDIVAMAIEWKASVVGVSLLTPLVREAYQLARALRSSGVRLLAGGPHATILPEEAVDNGFDAAVVGEGESVIVDAVQALLGRMSKDKVKGWVYRDDDGKIRRTEPHPLIDCLDELPLPAKHLIEPSDYDAAANRFVYGNVFTSRGCPAKCSYCAGGLFGKQFRFRSAESVLAEIIHLRDRYGVTHVQFMDDAMSMDRQRFRDVCKGIIQRKLGVTWNMMTRADTLNEELLQLAARSGCIQIEFGLESGNSDTLRRIHKPHSLEKAAAVVQATAEAGITPVVFFILGFPWEDEAAIEETKRFMTKLAPFVSFQPAVGGVLIPFPGTEIYQEYNEVYRFQGWWLDDRRAYDAPVDGCHSYFESQVFPLGAVLDADFFRYSPSIRHKIHDVFEFMYVQNLKRTGGILSRLKRRCLIGLSRKLDDWYPSGERRLFRLLSGLGLAEGTPRSRGRKA